MLCYKLLPVCLPELQHSARLHIKLQKQFPVNSASTILKKLIDYNKRFFRFFSRGPLKRICLLSFLTHYPSRAYITNSNGHAVSTASFIGNWIQKETPQ